MDEMLTEGLRARINGRQGQVTLKWGTAAGHPTRKNKWMRTSADRQEQPHLPKPWSSWGTPPALLEGQHSRAPALQGVLECVHGQFILQVIEEPSKGTSRTAGERLSASACSDGIRERMVLNRPWVDLGYISGRNSLLCSCCVASPAFLETLWMPQPWKYSRPAWKGLWEK